MIPILKIRFMMPRIFETVVHPYSSLVVQGIEPLLDFKRLHVLRDLVAPLGNQEVADVMVKDGLRVFRFRAGGYLRVELDLEVILRKLVEPDPLVPWVRAIDLDSEPEAINLDIRFTLGGEIADQTDNERCLLLAVDPVAKYPSHSFFPFHFLQTPPLV